VLVAVFQFQGFGFETMILYPGAHMCAFFAEED